LLLNVASLVNHEHRIGAAQVLDDIPAQVIADLSRSKIGFSW